MYVYALRLAMVLVGLAVCFALAGCSRPIGTVAGKVSYKGKPLKGGSVSLLSTEGEPSYAGEIGEDGTYTIQNARGGNYKVCVATAYLKGNPAGSGPTIPGSKKAITGKASDPDIPASGSNPRAAQEAHNIKRYVQIPDSYTKQDTTDLSYTVVGGNQTYDIELK
jgi:hypothetical protein